jgi:hypothetical protein
MSKQVVATKGAPSASQQAASRRGMQAALERATRVLDEAAQLDDLTEIRSEAETIRHYAKQSGAGLKLQNDAATIRLRAEQKAGRLLSQSVTAGSHAPEKQLPHGISRSQSSRWQRLADISDAAFESYMQRASDARAEITTAGLLRYATEATRSTSSDMSSEPREPAEAGRAEGQDPEELDPDEFVTLTLQRRAARILLSLAREGLKPGPNATLEEGAVKALEEALRTARGCRA